MATTISGSSGIDTQTVSVDDGGGTGPSVTIKGGGTSTDNPADNEQTLYLQTRNGTTSLSTGIGLWGTFENFPSDTNARRAADLRAGFNGGTWGNEYISFHVGVGTGTTSNDSAAMTTERLRLTKTTMTANVDIEDTVGNVRAPRHTQINGGDTTESNEGVYNIGNSATLTTFTIGSPAAGTVMVIYNNKASSITLARGSQITDMRKGADNDTTNNATLTLGARSLTTITVTHANVCIVTGTDVT
jgi:hypothetical protein